MAAARPSPFGAASRALPRPQPALGCGVGAPARPGPHDVGAVGPSAPPARSAALRPPPWLRPRLRRGLAMGGLPPHSPPGVAAAAPRGFQPPSRGRGLRVPRLRPLVRGLVQAGPLAPAGPQFRPPRALAAQAPPPRAFARGGARGTPPAGGFCRHPARRQGQAKRLAGVPFGPPRLRPCLLAVWRQWANVAGVPPSGGSPARFSFWGFRWCFYVCCCFSVLWRVCPSVVGSVSLPGCLSVCAVAVLGPALPVALCGGGFCGGPSGLGLPVLLCVLCWLSPCGRCPLRVVAALWVLSPCR